MVVDETDDLPADVITEYNISSLAFWFSLAFVSLLVGIEGKFKKWFFRWEFIRPPLDSQNYLYPELNHDDAMVINEIEPYNLLIPYTFTLYRGNLSIWYSSLEW